MNCRSCNGPTSSLLNLGAQPLANSLLSSPSQPYETYPLEVMLCESCHLGQLRDIVAPEKMFREYVYYTSVSGPSVESARRLVEDIHVPMGGLVVEIGSNDGYLLQFYKERGIKVLGIDPAQGPAKIAMERGITTIKDFFTADLAQHLPQADVIHANNVLAHVPDLNDFVAGLAIMLKPDGRCYVEVPCLANLVANCEFDTVYCEHSYYFSYKSLTLLLERHGLYVQYQLPLEAHGGSMRLRICHYPPMFAVHEKLKVEGMQARADGIAFNLNETLYDLQFQGKRVWGFGAAAKATVMLNYCGITSELIGGIADETPAKIGKYVPGTGIQIRHPDEWLRAQPDYTCIFAWNFALTIMERCATTYKGTFFTPYSPELVKERVS